MEQWWWWVLLMCGELSHPLVGAEFAVESHVVDLWTHTGRRVVIAGRSGRRVVVVHRFVHTPASATVIFVIRV